MARETTSLSISQKFDNYISSEGKIQRMRKAAYPANMGKGHPAFNGESLYWGNINLDYWVDDHPLGKHLQTLASKQQLRIPPTWLSFSRSTWFPKPQDRCHRAKLTTS